MFALKQAVIGKVPVIEISEAEYLGLVEAHRCTVAALGIEERFDLVLRNYEELEAELLRISLRSGLFFEHEWSAGVRVLQDVNRRVVNLLSSCRLYLDQTPHALGEIYETFDKDSSAFEQARISAHTKRLGYRVMEALRNYVQHRGMPLQSAVRSQQWIEAGEKTRKHIRTTIIPQLSCPALRADGKFKGSVLEELEAIAETHDLKLFAREYLEGLGDIHAAVRSTLHADLQTWDGLISSAIARYREAGGDPIGLAVCILEDGISTSRTSVFDEPTLHRQTLVRRNWATGHYTKLVATNY
jgi:hypothetical protein